MDNRRIAADLELWADVLESERAGRFRIQAYRRAADTVAQHPEPVAAMVERGADLTTLYGIGDAIAARTRDLVRGEWPELEAARQDAASAPFRLYGDLHAHTTATDGRATIEEMAQAAATRGYEYLAITDHSKATRIAGGLGEQAMQEHMQRIRRASEDAPVTLLAGAEVDILKDGRLDYPDDLLAQMDVVVCSVHFRHGLDGEQQTERILRGMYNEHAHILGHPTARRTGIRPGMAIDLERILDAAADQGWAVEMNGAPERLDLGADEAALAAQRHVPVAVSSDAHAIGELRNVQRSLRQADQAGIGPDGVLNAQPLDRLLQRLR